MSPTRARRVTWWALVVALAAATVAAASLGGWQMVVKSQPPLVADQPAARQTAMEAASTGTVRILSYSPGTFEQDFKAAEALLTGDFLSYYRQFTSQIVATTAREKSVTTTATVVRAGVETLTDQKAQILVFVNQTTTSRDKPDPTPSQSSVRVGLVRANGKWLIDRFDAL